MSNMSIMNENWFKEHVEQYGLKYTVPQCYADLKYFDIDGKYYMAEFVGDELVLHRGVVKNNVLEFSEILLGRDEAVVCKEFVRRSMM